LYHANIISYYASEVKQIPEYFLNFLRHGICLTRHNSLILVKFGMPLNRARMPHKRSCAFPRAGILSTPINRPISTPKRPRRLTLWFLSILPHFRYSGRPISPPAHSDISICNAPPAQTLRTPAPNRATSDNGSYVASRAQSLRARAQILRSPAPPSTNP